MSDRTSQPKAYEVADSDHDQIVPVASPGLLLSQILERLELLEERDRLREEEVAELREENARKDERIAVLEDRIAEHEGLDGRERALALQRIAKLETPAPAISQKTASSHIDRLFSEMRRLGLKQATVKDAARLLGVSKTAINNIKSYLAADSRFVVLVDPHHRQRHLIRLV